MDALVRPSVLDGRGRPSYDFALHYSSIFDERPHLKAKDAAPGGGNSVLLIVDKILKATAARPLNRAASELAGANADYLFQGRYENLAVAGLPDASGLLNGIDNRPN